MYWLGFKAAKSRVVAALLSLSAGVFLGLDLLLGFVPENPPTIDGARTARFLPAYLTIRDGFFRGTFGDFSPVVVIVIGIVIAGGLMMSNSRTGTPRMDEPMTDRDLARTILSAPRNIGQSPAAFFENNGKIFAEMQRRNPNFGKATTSKVIEPMMAVHELDLNATHQGGFGYYFSEESREEHWNAARQGLSQLGLGDLEAAFMRAQRAFRANEQARDDEFNRVGDAVFGRDESGHLREMAAIDAEWRANVSQLHAKLEPWRQENGFV